MKIRIKKSIEYLVRKSIENQKVSFVLFRIIAVLFWTLIFVGMYFYLSDRSDPIDFGGIIAIIAFLWFGLPNYGHVVKTADRKLFLHASITASCLFHCIYLE